MSRHSSVRSRAAKLGRVDRIICSNSEFPYKGELTIVIGHIYRLLYDGAQGARQRQPSMPPWLRLAFDHTLVARLESRKPVIPVHRPCPSPRQATVTCLTRTLTATCHRWAYPCRTPLLASLRPTLRNSSRSTTIPTRCSPSDPCRTASLHLISPAWIIRRPCISRPISIHRSRCTCQIKCEIVACLRPPLPLLPLPSPLRHDHVAPLHRHSRTNSSPRAASTPT